MASYIIADTHGCLHTLRNLLESKLSITKLDRLLFLGDFIDRGPHSAQLIEYLLNLKSEGYNLSAIRGNHEQMMLDPLVSNKGFSTWMLNSGKTTIESYKTLIGSSFCFPHDVPKHHIDFLNSLPYYLIVDRFILVHGALNFRLSNPFTDTDTMLWSRPTPIPLSFMPEVCLVYGHTPTRLYEIQSAIEKAAPRQIPLDGGCVYAGHFKGGGYLVALDIECMSLHWVEKSREDY